MAHSLAESSDYGGAILASILILALCIAGFFVVSLVRKRARENQDDAPPAGFTLADLRELHRSGKMSADEYERAKATLVAATKAAAAKSAAQSSLNPRPPAT